MVASGLKLSRTHRAGQRRPGAAPRRMRWWPSARIRPSADGSIEAGGSADHGTFDDPHGKFAFAGLGRQIW